MITKLIGFEISKGSFTNEKTGEVIDYSNRTLLCITDVGEDSKHVGFAPFEEKKIKMSNLASWLHVQENDSAVDNALKALIGKPVEFARAPRNGELVVVGFSAAKV